jgi:valyl-tRNA synthetase
MKITEKHWDINNEKEIYVLWENENWWKFNEDSENILIIDTPPPYTAPVWHAAAFVYTYFDIIARAYRMNGYSVLFPMGFDRNGLPIEYYVEKYLGITPDKVSREEYLKICKENLDKFTENMKKILARALIRENMNYLTDDPDYRKCTQETFIKLYKQGLIYESTQPMNWCPKCKTTISDAEIERKEVNGKLYYLKFFFVDNNEEYIPIATTRPELLGACAAVIVHPEDERYKKYIGKEVIVPLYGKKVKIYAMEEADPNFGTGAVMICSYGDFTDVEIFRKLKLKSTQLIDFDGKMIDKRYKGLTVKECRKKIVEDLKAEGYLIKEEDIKHSVPIHERCNTEIEILERPAYYLKQVEFKNTMRKLADELKIIPEKYKKRLYDWIDSVSIDWPISRERYYATEVPLWYCDNCGYVYVPEPGKYYQPWKEEKICPKCGSKMKGDHRVLDTWMDSSITPLYIMKYFEDKEFYNKVKNGIKLRPQGYEIIRTWLYYTLLRCYLETGERIFDIVFIHGMGLDEKGRKMSKRLGNVIDPYEMFETYGADTIRFWLCLETMPGEDFRISENRIKGVKKFMNKLWNIAKYVSMYEYIEECNMELYPTDKWILELAKDTENKIKEYYMKFRFDEVAKLILWFTRDVFSSHYIELTKERCKSGDIRAIYTLHQIMKKILKWIAPISPAMPDYIHRKLYGHTIHCEKFEEFKGIDEEIIKLGEKLMEFNSRVWKTKKEQGKSLKDEIEIEIPEELKIFEEDLRACHKIIS